MEQKLRFGLDLGRLVVMKKKGSRPIMSNFLEWFFHVFMSIFFLNIVDSENIFGIE